MANITYRITAAFLLANQEDILRAVFPAWNGEPASFDQQQIIVTFDSPQTPADLGPLVKVERVED